MAQPDDLDALIAKLSADDPQFPRLVETARRRRELLLALARERVRQDLSRVEVAEAMGTCEQSVEELESEAPDVTLPTIDRYAEALGYVVQYHLIPASDAGDEPVVVVRATRN
jgi:transcriptional regulator with XRE-family HTH domain